MPELADTSLRGSTVQHLLDMRTGTRFDESYDNPHSDVRQLRAGVPVAARRRAAAARRRPRLFRDLAERRGTWRPVPLPVDPDRRAGLGAGAGRPTGCTSSSPASYGSRWAPSSTRRSRWTPAATRWPTAAFARLSATSPGSASCTWTAAGRGWSRSSRPPGSRTRSGAHRTARQAFARTTAGPATRPERTTATAGGSGIRAFRSSTVPALTARTSTCTYRRRPWSRSCPPGRPR